MTSLKAEQQKADKTVWNMNTERKVEVKLKFRLKGHGTDSNFMAQTLPPCLEILP